MATTAGIAWRGELADVLVTGGTGLLGGRVVAALVRRGHSIRVMSRRSRDRGRADGPDVARLVRGDLASGLGLREAVEGAEAIVHCASATGARTRWAVPRGLRLQPVDVAEVAERIAGAVEAGPGSPTGAVSFSDFLGRGGDR